MRPLLAGVILLLAMVAAQAAPPPAGSDEEKDLGDYGSWFVSQASKFGNCCSLSDGRTVEVRVVDDHYEVRFIHPETLCGSCGVPEANKFYPVTPPAYLIGKNPTKRAIAWWSYQEIFKDGKSKGHTRCFMNGDTY